MATAVVQPEEDGCQCGHSHHHHHRGHTGDGDAEETMRLPPTCLAYQLWMPWRFLVLNPMVTLVGYVVFNGLFISLCLLVSLLVALLTLPGLLLVIAMALFYGLRQVALLVTFPGQLGLVVRDGESNFAKLTKRRLTMALDASQELVVALGDSDTSANHHKRMRFLQRHQNFVYSMETLVLPILHALESVEKDGLLGPNGATLLAALQDLTTFQKGELAKFCGELTSANAKEFEMRRQQIFLTPTPATANSVASAATSSSPTWLPGPRVASLSTKTTRVRELLPLIGPPASTANAKKDIAWVARELCFQRKATQVDIITTLDFIRADLTVRFHGEQVWINGHDNHQIDAMFIPAASGFAIDKPVMVLCNPNGGLYEFHHFQMDWIKFYTDLGCHVFLFNYRGYGRNKGVPSPWAHNLDAVAIVDFLKNRKGLTKIGVHGESIGGLVATFLASHSGDGNAMDVLIADRTFANLPALAQRLVASWAGKAVNWLTWWETDNAGKYLAAKCPKLLCSDPNDEIISDGASLKSGVALRRELGDHAFDVPAPVPLHDDDGDGDNDDQEQGEASLLDTFPVVAKLMALVTGGQATRGTTVVRRQSGAESRPQIGCALTETSLRRFCEASLSLGRRAMRYADRRDTRAAITSTTTASAASPFSSSSRATSANHVEIAVSESAASLPVLSFPEELLAVVWMQLASLDGYCGQCFLQAAESGGYDRVRSWTASMLTWGGQLPVAKRQQLSLEPFDRQGLAIRPLTIFHVYKSLQAIAEKHPGAKFDHDLGVILQMIEYIMDSLQRRWALVAEEAKMSKQTVVGAAATGKSVEKTTLGRLLVLHCGHNRQFADNEKAELTEFLRSVHFLPASNT